ncbi:MAG TPA: S-methyl-5'-thioadenosine phosphorylase [Candidatus Bathyarchaeota archaeon]|nr:S-methyl-5'-thioadenosine phosphorylase [Candidatus Bathyarchaeota archaeon]
MSSVKGEVEIGIIGGTGVYDPAMFGEVKEVKVYTPYGEPSDLVFVGSLRGKKVAFIPRHGRNHTIPPHRVNYRANIWALKELGVQRIVAPAAVGSLREDFKPGDFVIVDQFIDRTKKRVDTFYEGGRVCHISAADPFCPELRRIFYEGALKVGLNVHDGGTYVCIEGPRFSTRAESKLFRSWGADVIGMTLYPECVLAREMELCYVSISMVTDYDVWAEKPVSVKEVVETMKRNTENLKKLLREVIPKIPKERSCECGFALRDALV